MISSLLRKLVVSAQFWVLVCLFALMCLPLTIPVKWPVLFWVKQGFDYVLWAGTFYLYSKFIVPRVLFKGKTVVFILSALFSIIAIVQLNHQFDVLFNFKAIMARFFNKKANGFPDVGDFILIILSLIMLGLATVIPVVQRLQTDQLREQVLEKEKMISELSFLKTQINPHFFFNVLHTIYALIETDRNTARDSVYTLSHMMRYVLYDTKNDVTTLEKELAFIEDYIKLMRLRLTDQVQIVFDKPKNLNDVPIAPMLLLPFVENAFKHGTSTIHPSYIYIGIAQAANGLQIEIRNPVFTETAGHMEESNGIGLANTQRRLNLLYPNRHELTAGRDESTNEFIVHLKLLQP